MCNQYNGYANYPTWVIALWNDNDGWPSAFNQMARRAVSVHQLEHMIKEHIEAYSPLADSCSVYSVLIGWAIDNANFYELAKAYYEEENEEEE